MNRIATLLEAASALAPEAAGAFGPLERRGLLRQMELLNDIADEILSGLTQMSWIKYDATVQLRAFLATECEHAAWRLALTEPLDIDRILECRDLYVFEPLHIEVGKTGVGRVFEAIKKLALHAMELDASLARSGGRQLDFFQKPTEGLSEGERLEDPFGWLCRHALRITLETDTPRETVAYLIASYIADLRSSPDFSRCRPKPLRSLPHIFLAS
jgi:hypothetical protein